MLSASAGLKKAHMTKNAGFYIVSLVGKVLFKIPFPIYGLAIWLGRKATPVPFNRIESICG